MVGLSGGKDSWALMQTLDNLRKRAPIKFSLIAVNVDSGYKDFKHGAIAKACEERGWEYRIEHTSIGEVMDDILEANATPCSLCARLRRGVLYRIATEVGATKIALGHHLDDFVETLLLNLFFAGALKAMPARLVSDNGEHVVIRPLVYVGEDEARLYCKEVGLPIIGCCCPACGDLSLQRQRVKRLILDLEREHSGVKQSMLKALGNVMPRHLLDTRLNPSGELRDSAALRLEEEAAGQPDSDPALARDEACRSPRFLSTALSEWHEIGRSCMRAVIQRVTSARVRVGERVVGEIARGLLVLLGVGADDTDADVRYVAGKIRDVRVFESDAGKPMDRSVADVSGAVLVVSQFTLYGDIRKGRRPSFDEAAPPEVARATYEGVVRELRSAGLVVATGEFQAMMQVELVNDGPVTVLVDSRRQF